MGEDKHVSIYYESEPCESELEIDPRRSCLLIVDMQKQFILRDYGDCAKLKELGEWDKWVPYHDRLDNVVIPNTVRLLEYFRQNNLEVTFGVIGCHHKDGRDRSPVQKKSGWNDILLPKGTFGAQVIDELAPLPDEIVVYKTTDSVLAGTNYAHLLRNMGIRHVVVTGIVTDQCVASTVRSLADEGFDVIVVEDCCAAGTKELHDAELRIMNKIYCEIMTTDQTIEYLNRRLALDLS